MIHPTFLSEADSLKRQSFSPFIRCLTLTDFRNHACLRLEPKSGLIALTGLNGAGKTNILEALSLLNPGHGLRGAKYSDMVRCCAASDKEQDQAYHTSYRPYSWGVSVIMAHEDGDIKFGTAWQAGLNDETKAARSVLLDGHIHKSAAIFYQHVRLLWLTPAMDRLFSIGAGERRRFFDRMVCHFAPAHNGRLNRFDKLLRERMSLLLRGRWDVVWLESLEAQMAEIATAIAAARLELLSILQTYIMNNKNASAFPWAKLSILGTIENSLDTMPALQAEDRYRQILYESRGLDGAAGRCLQGPHRSDWQVVYGPKNIPAALCSTGEQKSLLTGLILAQSAAVKAHIGTPPLLLLDEAFAHLDGIRRRELCAALLALDGQAWLSGTDRVIFSDSFEPMQFFEI